MSRTVVFPFVSRHCFESSGQARTDVGSTVSHIRPGNRLSSMMPSTGLCSSSTVSHVRPNNRLSSMMSPRAFCRSNVSRNRPDNVILSKLAPHFALFQGKTLSILCSVGPIRGVENG